MLTEYTVIHWFALYQYHPFFLSVWVATTILTTKLILSYYCVNCVTVV